MSQYECDKCHKICKISLQCKWDYTIMSESHGRKNGRGGDKMGYFTDCGLLLFLSFLSLFYQAVDAQFLIAFLCTLILICCVYTLKKKWAQIVLCGCFVLLSLAVPKVFLFYPCFVYLLFYEKIPALALGAGTGFVWQAAGGPDGRFFVAAGVFGFLLAFFLEKNTAKCRQLEQTLRKTRDDSRENSLLLSQKNKALLEKQDYEIYNATLKERNRIAREIHDNVGHVLSRSILMLGAARTINREAVVGDILENMEDSLNSAMNSIRSSVHDLHDEAVNLEEAEKTLVKEFTFCPVEMTYDMTREIPREVKYCFISITKEAFANIMKHSNATRVHLILREHPAIYQMCVEDNGTGAVYDPTNAGIGILNMKDRVSALGGSLQVSTKKGFRIFITIPK